MKYIPYQFTKTEYLMNRYSTNSLLSKVIEFNHYDEDIINGMLSSRLIYHDFSLFEDADIALDRIEQAIEEHEKICIYGDYDCDGIMATTILVQAFKELGIEAGYHIPNRFSDGYGLNKERVSQISDKGYSLIITVDNGITCFEAIDLANELGVDVIVTDHHALKDQLPDASAIIHTQISYEYPFKDICGAFVAYKLAAELLGRQDKYLYTLASIATLSDCMPLLDENRSIVKRGLLFMNEEHYQALELLIGKPQKYTTQLLNFTVIPKINSIGRLPEYCNPDMMVKYFLKDCDSLLRGQVASKCQEVNNIRKKLTSDAIDEIELEEDKSFIFYYSSSSSLHNGILGLIAGRLTNQYKKPSFILNYNEDTHQYIGSCRSITGFSIQDFFNKHADLFVVSGGHDLAGGFTIEENRLDIFKNTVKDALKDFKYDPSISTISIEAKDITIQNIESLSVLEPFGQSNNEPLFEIEDIIVLTVTPLSNGKHIKLRCKKDGIEFDALYFNVSNHLNQFNSNNHVTLIGTLSINNFRNMKNINFIIRDMI